MAKGIDVSSHNGKPNWDKVKQDGIEFAIIRMGIGSDQRSQDDTEYERNVKECERVGVHWGAYLYSYALSVDQAKNEVEHAKRLLKGKKPTYPIAFDMEDADHYKVKKGFPIEKNKQLWSDICYTWLSEMEKAGYDVRLYASKYWLDSILTDPRLNKFKKWVAQWSNQCTYRGSYDIWQNSDSGIVNGIGGRVDTNISTFKPTVVIPKENKPSNSTTLPNPSKPTQSAPSKPTTTPSKANMKTVSVVDYMDSVEMDSSFENRLIIATKEGIKNYKGTPEQNLKLLEILRGIGLTPSKTVIIQPKPKGDMKTVSVVDYLISIKVDHSFENRLKLANKYGIKNYKGTPEQNTQLLKKLRN